LVAYVVDRQILAPTPQEVHFVGGLASPIYPGLHALKFELSVQSLTPIGHYAHAPFET